MRTLMFVAAAALTVGLATGCEKPLGGEKTPGETKPGDEHPGAEEGGAEGGEEVPPGAEEGGALTADDVIKDWKEASKTAAQDMMEMYGQPDEVTESVLIWHENGGWLRTVVYKNEIPHDFPTPHVDVVEQWVRYRVPPDMFDDLARFDGSVMAERTSGLLSARCEKESSNILALNLADEIARGERTWQEARVFLGDQVKAMLDGKPAELTDELVFTPMTEEEARDPDEATITVEEVPPEVR